ncbi:hypothetical protein SAMN02910384_01730 [Pseudobutyrivibrio sp. ACV-2]|uniref:DUF6056 family protein n=1 Tax=Pseudobutyrivibrio sp. ACV-2 TaxID=1520801 RepID=UPI000894CFAD|nr:hypothetical protein [Pseudobutyrivibrio sp. ACV-2]SEA52635.1 hypothetical protein SAMN02910384_01730 [Pseudobutyrivibrio sp. ACV-2]
MLKKINIKEILLRIPLIIGYIWLLSPFVYSVYYSMPANDDFAHGINWWGSNLVGEALHRAGWNYMHSFGQSGVFAAFTQVLFNPLYWFKDRGHSFGICMVIVFLLVIIGTLYAVRRLVKLLGAVQNSYVLDIFTFLLALLLLTSYYYSDVYNWWSGVPGYSLMMMVSMFAYGNIVKYNDTRSKKDYILMIILGMITCTCLMNCVATGIFYVIYVFIYNYKNGEKLTRKILPLVLYIFVGLLMIAAPGIRERSGEDIPVDYVEALMVTAYRVKTRFTVSYQTRPWIILFIVLILLAGMMVKSEKKPKILVIIMGYLCSLVAAFGAVAPYVVGSHKTYDSEFTPRIYFVEDYLVFIAFAVLTFRLGQWLAVKIDREIQWKIVIPLGLCCVLINYIYCANHQEEIGVLIPSDIKEHVALIKESYYFWDDIIDEIIESPDMDVEIYRQNVDWCQYVYYTSLDDGTSDWDWSGDKKIYYGGCNQCAAIFYGKDRIRVYFNE